MEAAVVSMARDFPQRVIVCATFGQSRQENLQYVDDQ
jgi:hypothetical protein